MGEFISNRRMSVDDFDYLSEGLAQMIEHENCGYLPAFPSEKKNTKGLFLPSDDFIALLEDSEVKFSLSGIPSQFKLYIKYSPIALFKRWIFHISTVDLLKISERKDAYNRDFFFLILEDIPHLFPMTSNVAHESFLESIYLKNSEEVVHHSFSCPLVTGKKLVIYKDYKNRKVSSVTFTKIVKPKKMHNFKVSYAKSQQNIRFNILVDNKHKFKHLVRLKKEEEKGKKVEADANLLKKLGDYRLKSQKLLEEVHEKNMESNRHANISLGRVNKVPLLVNLPKRFADTTVFLKYNKSTETLEIYYDEKLIKSFQISPSPKSNWLKAV